MDPGAILWDTTCSKETERGELATKVCKLNVGGLVKYFLPDDGDMRSQLRKQLLGICIVAHVIFQSSSFNDSSFHVSHGFALK